MPFVELEQPFPLILFPHHGPVKGQCSQTGVRLSPRDQPGKEILQCVTVLLVDSHDRAVEGAGRGTILGSG